MNQDELLELQRVLERERDALKAELERIADKNPIIKDDYQAKHQPSDPSDAADIKASNVEEYEREHAVEQELELRLRDINQALEKIAAGAYGTCANCKSPISSQRLQAMPTATMCVDCSQGARLA